MNHDDLRDAIWRTITAGGTFNATGLTDAILALLPQHYDEVQRLINQQPTQGEQ